MDEKYIYALKFLRERGKIPTEINELALKLNDEGFGEYTECLATITQLQKNDHAKWATKDRERLIVTEAGLNRLNRIEEKELDNDLSINVFSGSNSGTIIQSSRDNSLNKSININSNQPTTKPTNKLKKWISKWWWSFVIPLVVAIIAAIIGSGWI